MTELSYQLYSSREFPPLRDTLHMLKEIGYTQIEGFGGIYGDVDELAELISESGLFMKTGHFGLDLLESDPSQVISIAKKLGMEAIFCPHIGPDLRPDTGPEWRAFGAHLQTLGKPIWDAGLTYGWHNHDFEFITQADGSIPMEEILKGGPDLSWEADIAWIVRGGGDPMDWIARHGSRMCAVHIKDIAPAGECEDEDGWADVGHGTMDWKSLMSAVQETPVTYFIMEHDKPSDDRRFANRSYDYIAGLEG